MKRNMGRLFLLLALFALALGAVCPTALAADMDEPDRILRLKLGIDGDDDDHDLAFGPIDQKQPTSYPTNHPTPDQGSLFRTLILIMCQGGCYRII